MTLQFSPAATKIHYLVVWFPPSAPQSARYRVPAKELDRSFFCPKDFTIIIKKKIDIKDSGEK